MEDKIRWSVLSSTNRPLKKMRELAKNFDKRKMSVDLKSDLAISIMEDIEAVQRKGYCYITYLDEEYPEELRNIAYPPPYLFVRGNVNVLKHPLKATIVGSRDATVYGMNVAGDFAHTLASNGVCVVTGGAKGIDAAATRGALRSTSNVIVVVGTGIDIDYPPENASLFKTVEEKGGVIVSEFPLGMGPLGRNFPIRNRVMTALGENLTVIEAAEQSGALISASHATEQGKTVFAVPGNIDSPNSAGTNALLRDGAQFAMSGRDILEELMVKKPDAFRAAKSFVAKKQIKKEEKEKNYQETGDYLLMLERAVVNALKTGKDTYEDIQEFTGMETKKLTSLLTIMEIKGIIKLAFNNRYKLN